MIVCSVTSPLSARALRGAASARRFAAARVAATPQDGAVRVPALDVVETAAGYTATLDVPGVAREQVEVSIEGRRVDVSTVAAPQADANRAASAPQREPRYARSIVLPAELEPGAAHARLDNGVLTLTLPKRGAARAATLSVQ